MYDENSDPHIQIAVDYNLKYKSRTTDIRKYLDHGSNLGDKFKRGQMYLDEMSQVLSYLSTASVVSLLPGLLYSNCVCIWSCFLCELLLSTSALLNRLFYITRVFYPVSTANGN